MIPEKNKICCACKRKLPSKSYYLQTASPDGWRPQCIDCDRVYHHEWQKNNPDKVQVNRERYENTPKGKSKRKEIVRRYLINNRVKVRARQLVRNRIFRGKLIKPDRCEECLQGAVVQSHHDDYSKPLEIKWLCRQCHKEVGARTKEMLSKCSGNS
jgi:hypothetical protein